MDGLHLIQSTLIYFSGEFDGEFHGEIPMFRKKQPTDICGPSGSNGLQPATLRPLTLPAVAWRMEFQVWEKMEIKGQSRYSMLMDMYGIMIFIDSYIVYRYSYRYSRFSYSNYFWIFTVIKGY